MDILDNLVHVHFPTVTASTCIKLGSYLHHPQSLSQSRKRNGKDLLQNMTTLQLDRVYRETSWTVWCTSKFPALLHCIFLISSSTYQQVPSLVRREERGLWRLHWAVSGSCLSNWGRSKGEGWRVCLYCKTQKNHHLHQGPDHFRHLRTRKWKRVS